MYEFPPRVSVLMPTFRQAAYIERALESLLAQTLANWELLIVDDGSPDETAALVEPYLTDARIRYWRLPTNRGLGAALNYALDRADAPLIAYLPSDDVYYAEHLMRLVAHLEAWPEQVLAYAGVRYQCLQSTEEQIPGLPLQLVQVLHRRTADRWLERGELVTDDLERMYWSKLRACGAFGGVGGVTCEWVDQPRQHHKLVQETTGGINPYRQYYGVREPLRFHSTMGQLIDEVALYAELRARSQPLPRADGLKILLVGELAYNPERVLALAERGHKLYGLWSPDLLWFNTVGPLPFGHVEELPLCGWQAAVRRVRPDVIYALLNWQAVPFAYHVLQENPGIPFVWHFKEGPFNCLEKNTWPQLVDLLTRSDGQVYASPELRDWFHAVLPRTRAGRSLVLDGDLPKREWLAGSPAARLAERDGELHTVVAGRPVGLAPAFVGGLAARGIHLHLYGDFIQNRMQQWIAETRGLAPGHLHLHAAVDQRGWIAEFSRYDAGWLHVFESGNSGELQRASWDDLNYPARMATLAVAGLPLLQRDNAGSIVATQSLARAHDLGVFFRTADDLADQLHNRVRMARVRANVWRQRDRFTFDHHVDRLIAFFRAVIGDHSGPTQASAEPSGEDVGARIPAPAATGR